MAENGKENRHYFWELVLSNVVGTAVGYALAYYATRQSPRVDGYIDKTIGFLESVRKKSQPGYETRREDI